VIYQSILILVLGLVFSIGVAWCLSAYMARKNPALFTVLEAKIDLRRTEDRARFAKLNNRASVVFLLLTICAGTATYFVLWAISSLRMMMLPSAMITVVAEGVVLVFIAGIAGSGVAMTVFVPALRHWWPEETKWYLAYQSMRDHGGGYERTYRLWGSIIVALALMPFPLTLNWYVQARDVGLIIHPFFAVHEQLFPYSDIRSIELVPIRVRHGYQDRYFVSFKDGRILKADSDFPARRESDYTPLIQLLSRKSGVPVKRG
jgi:hypothetical protein